MTRNTCPNCDKPIVDTGYLCHPCAGRMRDQLAAVATMWPDLQITITRRDRIGDPARSGAEKPLPYSVRASAVQDEARNTLTTWARHVQSERGLTMPTMPGRDPAWQAARWLATQADWLRNRPEGPQAADEIADAHDQVRRVIDRPAPRILCGTCVTCGAHLYAPPTAITTACPKGCDGVYDVAEQRAWMLQQAEDQIAHASLIARALATFGETVNPTTIRTWASKGRLTARGNDHAGRPTYAVRDVLEILRSDAFKPRKHQHKKAS